MTQPIAQPAPHDASRLLTRLGRWLLTGLAALSFAIGWVGIFVPGLPTTIFWIVAVLLAGKACPVVQRWVYDNPHVGSLVRDVIEKRSLPAKAKRHAIIGMWAMLAVSAFFMLAMAGVSALWWAAILPAVGIGVSGYILWGLKDLPTTDAGVS